MSNGKGILQIYRQTDDSFEQKQINGQILLGVCVCVCDMY